MTRKGKIARLPHFIREQLNRRLRDGEPGASLVTWLNGLPKVKEVLEQEFGGRPINEQNLSEWKQGGFEEWQRNEEARAWVQQLAEQSGELEDGAGDFSVNDWLSAPLAVALGQIVQAIATKARDDPGQLRLLLEVAREISILRRGDHEMGRVRLQRDRWEFEYEQAMEENRRKDIEAMKTRTKGRIWGALGRPLVAEMFGGGEKGGEIADFLNELNYGDPWLEDKYGLEKTASRLREKQRKAHDQTKSNSIKPDQAGDFVRPAPAGSIRPNSTESDQ